MNSPGLKHEKVTPCRKKRKCIVWMQLMIVHREDWRPANLAPDVMAAQYGATLT